MFATNVFAHVGDIHEFLEGVALLLEDDGVFVSQFPYVLDLVRENQFDTIYHEHLSYFSVKSLLELAARSKLEIFDYIVDSTPYKQGRFTPGTHIPIYAEGKILETKPDFVVILAWNFKDEIMKKNKDVLKYGGKFMVCIPSVKILS